MLTSYENIFIRDDVIRMKTPRWLLAGLPEMIIEGGSWTLISSRWIDSAKWYNLENWVNCSHASLLGQKVVHGSRDSFIWSQWINHAHYIYWEHYKPGGRDWDVQYGVVGVGLHEALDVEDAAGEVEAATRSASFECRVVPVIHLIEPVGRVGELALKWEYLQQHISTCQSHLYKLCANGDSRNFGINGWMIRAIKCGGLNRFRSRASIVCTLHPPMRFNFDRQWWSILGKKVRTFKSMKIIIKKINKGLMLHYVIMFAAWIL